MAAFTYDPTTDRGRVRQHMADTIAANAVFSDAEIDAALSTQGSVEGACYQLASFQHAHALRHASVRSKSNTGESMSVDDTRAIDGWKALMDHFRPFARSSSRMPVVTVTTTKTPSSDGWTST